MATLTEMVAAVVVQSSAVAFSHFGITVDTPKVTAPAPEERVVARTPAPRKVVAARVERASVGQCPDSQPTVTPIRA